MRSSDRTGLNTETIDRRGQGPAVTAAGLKSAPGVETMKHIIAVLLENEPGALSRVVALFSARGYNIESLTVAPTEDASLSRMTIVTTGSDEVIEQITKHLNRLIEVVKVNARGIKKKNGYKTGWLIYCPAHTIMPYSHCRSS